MATSDKAVSTEDFNFQSNSTSREAARLEAVLRALVEHKVETIKNDATKSSSIHSSPSQIVRRLRILSTSSASLKDTDRSENTSSKAKNSKKKIEHTSYKDSRAARRAGTAFIYICN